MEEGEQEKDNCEAMVNEGGGQASKKEQQQGKKEEEGSEEGNVEKTIVMLSNRTGSKGKPESSEVKN